MTMRQIKFRAKSIYTKEWVYGNLRIFGERAYISAVDSHAHSEVFLSTVGQFTGLADCNGKEIYEGDILEIDPTTHIRGCVIWRDDLAQFVVNLADSKQWYSIVSIVVRVIGNIHDNPDLIPNQPTEV